MTPDPIFMSDLHHRLRSFVVERHPFALPIVDRALEATAVSTARLSQADVDAFRQSFLTSLNEHASSLDLKALPDPTPGVSAQARLDRARRELLEACDGFLTREGIAASLTRDERREILHGMILTRAVDNRLKQFF